MVVLAERRISATARLVQTCMWFEIEATPRIGALMARQKSLGVKNLVETVNRTWAGDGFPTPYDRADASQVHEHHLRAVRYLVFAPRLPGDEVLGWFGSPLRL